jgi:RNA polymerase sigma-70 factor (ECF subfamily)
VKGLFESEVRQMDDEKIVELYWARDEEAIPATAEKYGKYCTSIAKNILGSDQDAEECVSDTYLSAWNAMPPHRPAVLSAFLGKITRNISINRFNRAAAQKRGSGEAAAVLDELIGLVSDSDSVEQEIDRRELVAAIDSFLGTLPVQKRSIFVCRYWYFDGIPEIASRFGMTENNISVTLSRIRLKLHNYLSERGFEL